MYYLTGKQIKNPTTTQADKEKNFIDEIENVQEVCWVRKILIFLQNIK